MSAGFIATADRVLARTNSLLCIGLDPDPDRMPSSARGLSEKARLRSFLEGIVEVTLPSAAAYKMQLASFLNYGAMGVEVLEDTVRTIAGRRLTILDLKANDFPNTMRLYHDAVFGRLGFDAATVSPWLGRDSLEPFAADPAHGIFLVAHSSNPGSRDLQDPPRARNPPWLEVVCWARALQRKSGNAGVVVGATFPGAVARARRLLGPSGLMLLPGIGAQGGELEASVERGVGRARRGLLISASRTILYASRSRGWAEAAGAEAARLNDRINSARR